MKLKSGYLLRNIASMDLVVPIGERVIEFKGIMTLNETGAFLWKQLQEEKQEEELVAAMMENFEVDEETARNDIREFTEKLEEHNLLEEEADL